MITEKEKIGWMGVFLCGGFSILALMVMWKPSCLYLSREGLSMRGLLRSYSYKWEDIKGFNVLTYRLSRMVIIIFPNPKEGQPDAGTLLSVLTRKREMLSDFYSIPPEEMADLLRTLRTHFLEERF